MAGTKTIAFRISEEQEVRLDALAKRTGRTKAFYLREAIDTYLDDIEEQYWADSVIAEWEASDKVTRPASELWSELGL
jgi:RHH-type rel operon transcriptional repressor/antitoxin RelB